MVEKRGNTGAKVCQRCSMPVSGSKKYCGLDNFISRCKTCQSEYKQKCQGRINYFCSKKCQANNPDLIASANKKISMRKKLLK